MVLDSRAFNEKKINLLGARMDALNDEEFIERIVAFASSGRRKTILYMNANNFNISFRDKEYRKIISLADLVYADGQIIVWISRLLGVPLPGRLNAADFFDKFCSRAQENKLRLFFLGGEDGAVKEAVANLKTRFQDLDISGFADGYFHHKTEEGVIEEINRVSPHVLIVGLGVPKQEKWIYEHIDNLDVNALWAVGGLFNLLSGRHKRAPLWMRKLGFEWVFRLCQEPSRLWKRYVIGNPVFLFRVACAMWSYLYMRRLYNPIKRFTDMLLSLFLSFMLLPLFFIIYFLIKFNSPGPVLLKQRRIGKKGKEFVILKFRTMVAETGLYEHKPDKNDKRITCLGRFLRHSGLDELPQLWNVMRGDMSLVGPRPEMPFIVETYSQEQKRRLSVVPGITGLWQVSGKNEEPIVSHIGFDIFYIDNANPFLDYYILAKTFYLFFLSILSSIFPFRKSHQA